MHTHNPAESPELQAARMAREQQAVQAATPLPPPPLPALRDPLPYCIYTTVALLAWLFSPPLAVACFAAIGLRAYWRAWRAGLCRSKCLLRDTRLVMAYLGLLLIAGSVAYVWRLMTVLAWLGW